MNYHSLLLPPPPPPPPPPPRMSTFGSTEVASFPGCNRRGETVGLYPGNKAAIGGIPGNKAAIGGIPGNKAAIGGIHVFEQVFVSSQESPQRIPIKVHR